MFQNLHLRLRSTGNSLKYVVLVSSASISCSCCSFAVSTSSTLHAASPTSPRTCHSFAVCARAVTAVNSEATHITRSASAVHRQHGARRRSISLAAIACRSQVGNRQDEDEVPRSRARTPDQPEHSLTPGRRFGIWLLGSRSLARKNDVSWPMRTHHEKAAGLAPESYIKSAPGRRRTLGDIAGQNPRCAHAPPSHPNSSNARLGGSHGYCLPVSGRPSFESSPGKIWSTSTSLATSPDSTRAPHSAGPRARTEPSRMSRHLADPNRAAEPAGFNSRRPTHLSRGPASRRINNGNTFQT